MMYVDSYVRDRGFFFLFQVLTRTRRCGTMFLHNGVIGNAHHHSMGNHDSTFFRVCQYFLGHRVCFFPRDGCLPGWKRQLLWISFAPETVFPFQGIPPGSLRAGRIHTLCNKRRGNCSMHKHPIRRGAAALLAALTLVQGAALSSLAAQVEQADGIAALSQTKEAAPQLQNGSAVIPAGSSPEQVKEILAEALVANAQELDAQ